MPRLPVLLLGALWASLVSASEPQQVLIQTLLSPQADSYQRRMVTIEGVARDVSIQTTPSARCTLYGRGTFTQEDDTGNITVDLLGSCFPGTADAWPQEGDHIRLTAVVHELQSTPPRQVRL